MPLMEAVHQAQPVGWVLVIIYCVSVALGRAWMTGRPPFDLRPALVAWNAALAAFSMMGFCIMTPHFVAVVWQHGMHGALCTRDRGQHFRSGQPGLWMFLFMLSKVPELLDTAFLVLRKRPVIFLHWYHHASVLLYCWLAYGWRSNLGLVFATMNYAVHSVMYAYYALAAAGRKPTWGSRVTLMQITQMIAGCSACAYAWVQGGALCDNYYALVAATVLYASYLALFVKFFTQRDARSD
jgi:hypothetical protein